MPDNTIKPTALPVMKQGPVSEITVERAHLPRMSELHKPPPTVATAPAGKHAMAAIGEIVPTVKQDSGPGRMAPPSTAATPPNHPGVPQQRRPPVAGAPDDKYVRLVVTLDHGVLTVLSAHEVAGPLSVPTVLHAQYAYEVEVASQRVAAEAMHDLTTSRSWPRPGELEHYVHQTPRVQFNVRIPHIELSVELLAKMRITLYQFKDASSKVLVGRDLIETQHAPQVSSVVARTTMLHIDSLAAPVSVELRRILPARK